MKPTLDEKPQVPITQDLKRISDISSNGFGQELQAALELHLLTLTLRDA